MIRIPIASFIIAGSIAALATPEAKAQSPDPALLAPPAAQAGLAPPIWSPQPYGTRFRLRDRAGTQGPGSPPDPTPGDRPNLPALCRQLCDAVGGPTQWLADDLLKGRFRGPKSVSRPWPSHV
jgi:hypothetical protein